MYNHHVHIQLNYLQSGLGKTVLFKNINFVKLSKQLFKTTQF